MKLQILTILLLLITNLSHANEGIERIENLLIKDKVESITLINSSFIQVIVKDTLFNSLNYFNVDSDNPQLLINHIEEFQIEEFGEKKIEVVYLNNKFADVLSWGIPIFLLILAWTPGLLAIVYFIKSELGLIVKLLLIGLLVLIPVSGWIVYPFRKKIANK